MLMIVVIFINNYIKNKIMRNVLIVILVLSMYSCTGNKSNSVPEENNQLIKMFFLSYSQKGVVDAMNYLYSTNEWIIATDSVSVKTVSQLQSLSKELGNYVGYEILRKEKIGKSMYFYSSLVKYERQPLRFNFILYYSKDKWRFQEFQFDSNVTSEIQELANISWYH